jgi:hypothetical protein
MGDRFWRDCGRRLCCMIYFGRWVSQRYDSIGYTVLGRPATWRAPTWSWLSVQSPVSRMAGIQDVEIRDSVQLEDIHYVSTGPVYMGGVLEAEIALRLPLTKATIEKHDSDSGYMRSSNYLPHFAGNTVFGLKEDYLLHLPGEYHISSDTEVFFAPLWIIRAQAS